jgi:hypothetical protein
MRIGIAADHGGFALKGQLTAALKAAGYEVADFGAYELVTGDDYPDFVAFLARAVAWGEVTRGLAICGSGEGSAGATVHRAGQPSSPLMVTLAAPETLGGTASPCVYRPQQCAGAWGQSILSGPFAPETGPRRWTASAARLDARSKA